MKKILWVVVLACTTNLTYANDPVRASIIAEFIAADETLDLEPYLQGFPQGNHLHGLERGGSVNHTEFAFEADFASNLMYKGSVALIKEEEGYNLEVEESYLDWRGVLPGLSLKIGQMLSGIGYISNKHVHALDFSTQPLVYSGMFGGHAMVKGLGLNYVAPTNLYWETGVELNAGKTFPTGHVDGALTSVALYSKIGDDFSQSSSWQLGLGVYQASNITRNTAAHEHEEEHGQVFEGDVSLWTLNAAYKWQPNKAQSFVLAAEYFNKVEEGHFHGDEEHGHDEAYEGNQSGWYIKGVYQWAQPWRVGLRYGQLSSDNKGDDGLLSELELSNSNDAIVEVTAMVEYSIGHNQRFRLQYSHYDADEVDEGQWVFNYTHSFGQHAAHSY